MPSGSRSSKPKPKPAPDKRQNESLEEFMRRSEQQRQQDYWKKIGPTK